MSEYIDITYEDFKNLDDCSGNYCVSFPHGVQWMTDNKVHRIGAPAVIRKNGNMVWFVRGSFYTDNASYQKAAGLTSEDMLAMILKYGDVS